jgi:3-hydroxybutyrate dehydrogenase
MLKGKTAVVTGSTSGIGLGIARALAKEGVNVVINGFGDKAAIETERSTIEKEFAVKALYSPADMTKPPRSRYDQDGGRPSERRRARQQCRRQHVAPIEFPVEKWNAIIAINLAAAFHAIRAAVPGMKARRWGRIISTASAHSLVASPFKAAYVTAKHGLTGLTKTVALELATFGVTANCISPGYVWTPLVEKQIPDTMKARNMTEEQVKGDVLLAAQPTKQFVTIEQVASLPSTSAAMPHRISPAPTSRSTAVGRRNRRAAPWRHSCATISTTSGTAARSTSRLKSRPNGRDRLLQLEIAAGDHDAT